MLSSLLLTLSLSVAGSPEMIAGSTSAITDPEFIYVLDCDIFEVGGEGSEEYHVWGPDGTHTSVRGLENLVAIIGDLCTVSSTPPDWY